MAKFQVEELEQRFEMGWLGADHETEISVDSDGNAELTHKMKW
ncbi:hypothetical protein [uncultured Formosa sp.]|nr:hypothetical protein [uncultured Formosa sp.]